MKIALACYWHIDLLVFLSRGKRVVLWGFAGISRGSKERGGACNGPFQSIEIGSRDMGTSGSGRQKRLP